MQWSGMIGLSGSAQWLTSCMLKQVGCKESILTFLVFGKLADQLVLLPSWILMKLKILYFTATYFVL